MSPMPFRLNRDDAATIRVVLGPSLGELHQTMLDVDSYPSFLFSDKRRRLEEARNAALRVLERWVDVEPLASSQMCARLPDMVRRSSQAESLLEAATWALNDPLIDSFDSPSRNSRVFKAAPDLVNLLDESGLVNVDGIDARPWGLHWGEYAFQYHQLMRRDFRSHIHYGLIAIILRASERYHLNARLALDERRLQHRDEYQEVHEADYWYGSPLTETGLDDLRTVGETFHGDPQGGASLLNPYAGLSVRWTASDGLKTVEIEEFMPPPEPETDWVFARYLHAIRDPAQRAFIHCDGAVKAYAADRYPRTQEAFRNRGKGDRYRKLFRIDGTFPTSTWSELASSWFRGNRLINEYFESTST